MHDIHLIQSSTHFDDEGVVLGYVADTSEVLQQRQLDPAFFVHLPTHEEILLKVFVAEVILSVEQKLFTNKFPFI